MGRNCKDSEGATSTHHTRSALESVTDPFAPSRIDNAHSGRRYAVRSQTPTPLASRVSRNAREAVSNLRNLLCVKLAYHCRNQNALQQDFKRHAKPVGPLAQECPVFRLNVIRSQFYYGVRALAASVSVRDSIIRHGRFLSLNGLGVGCVRAGLSFIATASPLFFWCAHYEIRIFGCQHNSYDCVIV